ncbi:ABC transporter ATP-binding protein [Dactylosporangium sp. CA-233914]|uniref:ABC transporter ATP-binding protein n=1 Tax=Dactylosporangium sp. CA-233914 TaxID=3239934 RepID=UPI003D94B312
MSALRAVGVHAGYGPVPVVRAVDLHVSAGEILAVVGANGAGKTTLLTALAGLLPLSGGHLEVADARLTRTGPEQLTDAGVALVPEGRRLFQGLTVEEHLTLGRWRQRVPRAEFAERRRHVVELFPILEIRKDASAEVLSGGEQQMLAIGLALMRAPKVLMLDEPSIGLAPVIIDLVFAVLDTLRAQGQAIIIVEQRVQKVLQLADRAVVIQHGTIVAEGPARELATDPRLHAAYLGASSIDLD